MMLAFMISALLVAAIVAVAAAATERAAIPFRVQGLRWIWTAAMLVAAVVPTIRLSQSRETRQFAVRPSVAAIAAPGAHSVMWRDLRRVANRSREFVVQSLTMRAALRTERALGMAWLLASGALGLSLLASSLRLQVDARRWESVTLEATPVRITDDYGPALLGLWRPLIVLPQWVRTLDARSTRAILAHERAHRDAGDMWLLATAIVLVVAMPWNLPLWWMRLRLRRAVELDCDLRVVTATGMHSVSYASVLLDAGERVLAIRRLALAPALVERDSELRHRIRRLLSPARPSLRRGLIAVVALVICGVVIMLIPQSQRVTRAAPVATMPPATANFYQRAMRLPRRLQYFSGYDQVDPAILERMARLDSLVADEVRMSDGSATDRARVQRRRAHLMDDLRAALDSASVDAVETTTQPRSSP